MAYQSGLGVSFQPGADNGAQRTPVQRAVQLLSLRLPTVIGAQGISPQALLQSQGGAGIGGGMSPDAAMELLRRLLGSAGQPGGFGPNLQTAGGFGGGGGFAMPTTMSTPLPRIIPQENPDNGSAATKDAGLPPQMDRRGPDTYAGGMDRERNAGIRFDPNAPDTPGTGRLGPMRSF